MAASRTGTCLCLGSVPNDDNMRYGEVARTGTGAGGAAAVVASTRGEGTGAAVWCGVRNFDCLGDEMTKPEPTLGMEYWWNQWVEEVEPFPIEQLPQPQAMTALCHAMEFAQWFADRLAR